MCELFGFDAASEQNVTEYIKDFYARSIRHPHGWGLAIMNENEHIIEKEPRPAYKSEQLKKRLERPVQGKRIFGHIRYATVGNLEINNSHPFTGTDCSGRRWTLIHNGTIFRGEQLEKYKTMQTGTTDSERLFLYLLDSVNQKTAEKGEALNDKERFQLLDSLIVKISDHNKLNLMIYDDETMYIHVNYRRSMYYLQKRDSILFATKPLSEEDWRPVPMTTLFGYRDSFRIFTGTNHQHEYRFERHYSIL